MHLQAPHCPSCGAPIEVPVGAERVTCTFCQTTLVVHAQAVSTHHATQRPAAAQAKAPPFPEPDATLRNWAVRRFELSLIEQPIPGAVPEVFAGFELPEARFAFVSLRAVDTAGVPVATPLEAALQALSDSLAADADPGLAANLALDALCRGAFSNRLEVAIALFDPHRMTVTPYAAGAREAFAWASSEEARTIVPSGHGQALERKSLRERGDHFENGRVLHLAANDLLLFPSPGFLGRGAKGGYGNGLRALLDVANAQLGEAPLRIVTLAKNAFWEDFQKNTWSRPAPTGDVKLVAVRALLPDVATALPPGRVETLRTRRYEVALLRQEHERVALLPLHDERHALVWLGAPMGDAAWRGVCDAVLAVLDRKDHGDNDNPRAAGRQALATLDGAAAVPLLVAHLSDRYQRVKWFRQAWKQPVQVGPRGVKGDGHQAFDEGGEATVHDFHRLFFPGTLAYDGQPQTASQLAEVWPGGKASRLYEALEGHWKTKRSQPALEQLVRAALSDAPGAPTGLALITGVP
ncbi:MAG: hypothetical protein JNJ54_12145 [Myxococcaceae bacterium]|nr:hypothetical protein [Myxococcaceae bacterium]